MIWKVIVIVLPVLAVLAAATVPIVVGALLRLVFPRMHRNLPTLLAAAMLFFMQQALMDDPLSTLLSIVMNATPDGNSAWPAGVVIVLIVYPLAGLAIPFIFAWIGASFVDRIRNKRKPNIKKLSMRLARIESLCWTKLAGE